MDNSKNKVSEDTRVDHRMKVIHTGPLLNESGKALRPFVITGREKVKDGVFQYGHTLPTMSIDDYLAREMERGNFLSGGGYALVNVSVNHSEKSKDNGEKLDIEDEDDSDLALLKKRDWDEFKDHNPRGLGNRYNQG